MKLGEGVGLSKTLALPATEITLNRGVLTRDNLHDNLFNRTPFSMNLDSYTFKVKQVLSRGMAIQVTWFSVTIRNRFDNLVILQLPFVV